MTKPVADINTPPIHLEGDLFRLGREIQRELQTRQSILAEHGIALSDDEIREPRWHAVYDAIRTLERLPILESKKVGLLKSMSDVFRESDFQKAADSVAIRRGYVSLKSPSRADVIRWQISWFLHCGSTLPEASFKVRELLFNAITRKDNDSQVAWAEEIMKAREREKYSAGSQPGWNELVLTFWLPLGLYGKSDAEAAAEIGLLQNLEVTKTSRRNVTTARNSMRLHSARHSS